MRLGSLGSHNDVGTVPSSLESDGFADASTRSGYVEGLSREFPNCGGDVVISYV